MPATNPTVVFMFDRTWLERAKREKVHPGSRTRSHLVRLTVEPGFPSAPVVRAYLEPSVDASKETFSWGTPNLDELRSYPLPRLSAVRSRTALSFTTESARRVRPNYLLFTGER